MSRIHAPERGGVLTLGVGLLHAGDRRRRRGSLPATVGDAASSCSVPFRSVRADPVATLLPTDGVCVRMSDRPLLVRALWFVAVGWWLTPGVVNVAWLLNATVIGIPLGIKLLNLVPTALTLKEPRTLVDSDTEGRGQYSLLLRAVYFVLIGWWLSLAWANLAAVLAITIVGLPVAILMFNLLPFVTSLYRFDG